MVEMPPWRWIWRILECFLNLFWDKRGRNKIAMLSIAKGPSPFVPTKRELSRYSQHEPRKQILILHDSVWPRFPFGHLEKTSCFLQASRVLCGIHSFCCDQSKQHLRKAKQNKLPNKRQQCELWCLRVNESGISHKVHGQTMWLQSFVPGIICIMTWSVGKGQTLRKKGSKSQQAQDAQSDAQSLAQEPAMCNPCATHVQRAHLHSPFSISLRCKSCSSDIQKQHRCYPQQSCCIGLAAVCVFCVWFSDMGLYLQQFKARISTSHALNLPHV